MKRIFICIVLLINALLIKGQVTLGSKNLARTSKVNQIDSVSETIPNWGSWASMSGSACPNIY